MTPIAIWTVIVFAIGVAAGFFAGRITAPQPAPQAPAPKPLTQVQVVDGFCNTPHQVQYVAVFDAGVRFAEKAHGITGEAQG